ncbi:MAG: hypothetical protein WBQ10_19400, partial [Terriglobales bacterium]
VMVGPDTKEDPPRIFKDYHGSIHSGLKSRDSRRGFLIFREIVGVPFPPPLEGCDDGKKKTIITNSVFPSLG